MYGINNQSNSHYKPAHSSSSAWSGDYFGLTSTSGTASQQFSPTKKDAKSISRYIRPDFPTPSEFFQPSINEDVRNQYYYQDRSGRIIQPTAVVHSTTGSGAAYEYPNSPFHAPPQPPSPSALSVSSSEDSLHSSNHSTGSNRSVHWDEQRLVSATPPPRAPRPRGFWNRKGEQLWTNDGRYKAARPGCEYPLELNDYPEPGVGWMNEEGVIIDMQHRRISKLCRQPLKSALKKSCQSSMIFNF